jgi:hypothetical protein
LFERFKIEDDIFMRFDIEIEHIIKLQRDVVEGDAAETSMTADTTAEES